ncbi:hypothetical protein KDA_49560 [Dictyobacter alpinus]|uniref:Uncharacterized protein n=1 Tax=Dictyobacter alpinus TaxID=2014873 RepID=A0A402BDV4_9CHLR|nr:hypothetical protein [Dictyobacter alpinus]GCE29472.1 hypothetical protein KDA_49560 [Dictyobacter alpinus]
MANIPPEDVQNHPLFTSLPPLLDVPQPPPEQKAAPAQNPSLFYTQEDDLDFQVPPGGKQDEHVDQSDPFVVPFQNSAAMPVMPATAAQHQGTIGSPSPATTPPAKKGWGTFHVLRLLLIGSIVFVTIIGASLFVFAQSTPSANTTHVNTTNKTDARGTTPAKASKPTPNPPAKKQAPTKQPPSQPSTAPSHSAQGTQGPSASPSEMIPSTQQLNTLGWTQAGLTLGDALEALRTGNTFTDREMSYDYRNIGTPTNHSGTLTGSTFLLTPGGKERFLHNDVRMINNMLYTTIHDQKIIQQVVNVQPSLAQLQMIQVQGQSHTFVWVNVPFELLQSKLNLANGKRTETIQRDPATGKPLQHHMAVVLVRVAPQNQGANAPMGGTGWLVNTYALDPKTMPTIEIDPSL